MGYKLVLGLGDNIDYEIVWNSAVLEALAQKYGIDEAELSVDQVVADERSLVRSILAFLKAGEGGEYFVSSPDIIEQFSERFVHRITLGGTPIRAAVAVAKLGYRCALHYVTMNGHVRRLTPAGCAYVCSCTEENSYPHLIVQFRKGDCVTTDRLNIVAPHANRIIYDHDPENIRMVLNEAFGEYCPDAKVFLISGFNAMQDAAVVRDRISVLKRMMARLPDSAAVYYEDGGFYDDRLRQVVREGLEVHIDIHGMNEDELQTYLGRKLDLLDAQEMTRALQDIARMIGTRTILVHTKYWALVYGRNVKLLERALAGGIDLAGTRYRFGDDFTIEQYEETKRLPRVMEGQQFADALKAQLGERVCCLPSARVMETNVTTVGLGDAFVGGFLSTLSDLQVAYDRT
ncbi:MAG: ADP-dependent glucokinase/phosphofructokinase [Clostridia bacterium]